MYDTMDCLLVLLIYMSGFMLLLCIVGFVVERLLPLIPAYKKLENLQDPEDDFEDDEK